MKLTKVLPALSVAVIAVTTAAALAAPTAENVRSGAGYFIGRAGTSWSYVADKGKAHVTVDSVENWASRFHVEWGKRSISGTWRVRDGAWVEKLPSHDEAVVLPAQLSVGTRWTAPSSIERGEKGNSKFEVISMDAQVELASGNTREGCVAVLETGDTGGAFTHFYAPNTGKVAVQGPDGWVLRLSEFRAGRGGGD
ncbi:MAG: hypothetical protein IPJ65_10935 [Archangiaceae bacterium]|nr:hypothetical protein [Archangiaceae bacterium]